MAEVREVIRCVKGRCCDGLLRHGWDCPLSNPLADVGAALMTPSTNPILDGARRAMLASWGFDDGPQ